MSAEHATPTTDSKAKQQNTEPSGSELEAPSAPSLALSHTHIFKLQRLIGNQAVQRLLASQRSTSPQIQRHGETEPLPPGNYRRDPMYVDNNITNAYYNILTNTLTITYQNGSVTTLIDSEVQDILNPSSPPSEGQFVTIEVYARDATGRIYPGSFNHRTAPVIMQIGQTIRERRPDAERQVIGAIEGGMPSIIVSWGAGGAIRIRRPASEPSATPTAPATSTASEAAAAGGTQNTGASGSATSASQSATANHTSLPLNRPAAATSRPSSAHNGRRANGSAPAGASPSNQAVPPSSAAMEDIAHSTARQPAPRRNSPSGGTEQIGAGGGAASNARASGSRERGASASGGTGGGSPRNTPLSGDVLALGGEGETAGAMNFNRGDGVLNQSQYAQAQAQGRVVQGDFTNASDWQQFGSGAWNRVEANNISLNVGDAQPMQVLASQAYRVLRPGGTLTISRNSAGLDLLVPYLRDAGFTAIRVIGGGRRLIATR